MHQLSILPARSWPLSMPNDICALVGVSATGLQTKRHQACITNFAWAFLIIRDRFLCDMEFNNWPHERGVTSADYHELPLVLPSSGRTRRRGLKRILEKTVSSRTTVQCFLPAAVNAKMSSVLYNIGEEREVIHGFIRRCILSSRKPSDVISSRVSIARSAEV